MNQFIGCRACLAGIGGSALLLTSRIEAARLHPPRQVLQNYFKLINQRRFYAALHVWELETDGRNSAGQNLAQFKAGFAKTRSVVAQIGPEGESDSGAGSEWMPLDVTLFAALRSGKQQLFEGSYTMRRSLNPGGHQDWLISTASMSLADRD